MKCQCNAELEESQLVHFYFRSKKFDIFRFYVRTEDIQKPKMPEKIIKSNKARTRLNILKRGVVALWLVLSVLYYLIPKSWLRLTV